MVAYSLERHADYFDFLAFESDKKFAVERAASRWLELHGEEPVVSRGSEALEREGELKVPLRIFVVKDGQWERVSEVSYEKAKKPKPDVSLEADREFLRERSEAPSAKFDFSRFKR